METITKPNFSPKGGYVEVIDEYGQHVYKPTPETEERLRWENRLKNIENAIERGLSL